MRETHYTPNRVYLLAICALSLIIPVVQLGFLKPAETVEATAPLITEVTQSVAWLDVALYIYLTGVVVLSALFAVKLYRLKKLISKHQGITNDGYKLIYLDDSNTAFSFFSYLFIGARAPGIDTITRHELVHIHQRHSADILFLELFKAINWFNPVVYFLQNSLKTQHEYIADEQTASSEMDVLTYSSFLVSNAYGISGPAVTHSFFNYNLLKKRIIMLNQQRSGNLARLKYLLALPLCAALLCTSTLAFSKTYGWIDVAPQQTLSPPPPAPPVAVKDAKKKLPPPPPVPPATKPKSSAKLTEIRLSPPPPASPAKAKPASAKATTGQTPPKPMVDQVKFPPKRKVDQVKFPPKRKVDQVKFPPPVVKPGYKKPTHKTKTDRVKFPPPVVKPENGVSPDK